MVDAQRLHWQRKHDASQVVRLRDRTSADRVDTVCSCELKCTDLKTGLDRASIVERPSSHQSLTLEAIEKQPSSRHVPSSHSTITEVASASAQRLEPKLHGPGPHAEADAARRLPPRSCGATTGELQPPCRR